MVSKNNAKYFSKEQREGLCKWCKKYTNGKCKDCGFAVVDDETNKSKDSKRDK